MQKDTKTVAFPFLSQLFSRNASFGYLMEQETPTSSTSQLHFLVCVGGAIKGGH